MWTFLLTFSKNQSIRKWRYFSEYKFLMRVINYTHICLPAHFHGNFFSLPSIRNLLTSKQAAAAVAIFLIAWLAKSSCASFEQTQKLGWGEVAAWTWIPEGPSQHRQLLVLPEMWCSHCQPQSPSFTRSVHQMWLNGTQHRFTIPDAQCWLGAGVCSEFQSNQIWFMFVS